MAQNDMRFWFYNESWPAFGYVGTEENANYLADKNHLIIFEATEADMDGLY